VKHIVDTISQDEMVRMKRDERPNLIRLKKTTPLNSGYKHAPFPTGCVITGDVPIAGQALHTNWVLGFQETRDHSQSVLIQDVTKSELTETESLAKLCASTVKMRSGVMNVVKSYSSAHTYHAVAWSRGC